VYIARARTWSEQVASLHVASSEVYANPREK
jgi:hypothetical protein